MRAYELVFNACMHAASIQLVMHACKLSSLLLLPSSLRRVVYFHDGPAAPRAGRFIKGPSQQCLQISYFMKARDATLDPWEV